MSARVIVLSEPRLPQVTLTDEALVAACGLGDSAALRTLFRRHESAVTRFVGRLLGPDSAEVDDIVQQTFLAAWHGAKRFRARASVRSWLFGIAANHTRQLLKKRRRRADLNDRFTAPSPVPAPTGEEYARTRQAVDRLARALDALPPNLKIAFVLCDIENFSGTEAARMLRVRPGTLWRRLHEARRALRSAVKENDP